MPPPPRLLALLLAVLLVVAVAAHGRLLVSDGVPAGSTGADSAVLRLPSAAGEQQQEGCEMTYGFLPCKETAGGNLFLALAYGFLMFKAATYLSAGNL